MAMKIEYPYDLNGKLMAKVVLPVNKPIRNKAKGLEPRREITARVVNTGKTYPFSSKRQQARYARQNNS